MKVTLLRELSKLLEPFDDLMRERRKTEYNAKAAFGPRHNWKCAICGRSMPAVPLIAAAHITPLQECGSTTQENLIPLCEGIRRFCLTLASALDLFSPQSDSGMLLRTALTTLGMNADELGCHKLLDGGLISRKQIRQLRTNTNGWGKHSGIREAVFDTPLCKLNSEYSPSSARIRTLARLKRTLKDSALSPADWFNRRREIISAARRLTSIRYLKMAKRHSNELEVYLTSRADVIPLKSQSQFLYEKALLFMIDDKEPNLQAAINALEKSCDLATQGDDVLGWAMSRLEWVHASTWAATEITPEYFDQLMNHQNEAIQILIRHREPGLLLAIRWQLNSLVHRAELEVKAGRMDAALATIKCAKELRDKLTVTEGWAEFQAVHLNTTEAAACALKSDFGRSLKLLSRGLVLMQAGVGKRPEGYKDIANCAAWVFEQRGNSELAGSVRSIADRMVDGRSGLWRS